MKNGTKLKRTPGFTAQDGEIHKGVDITAGKYEREAKEVLIREVARLTAQDWHVRRTETR